MKRNERCSGFGVYYLIEDMSSPIGIEIGSETGATSEHLLCNKEDLTLHCVDPFMPYTDKSIKGAEFPEHDNHYEKFLNRMKSYGDRMVLHRKTSDEALEEFEDNAYDFIFIDGLHEYNQVKTDMENYYSKIKDGGVFAGHDYNYVTDVKQAVDEFAAKIGIKEILHTDHDVWYWIKGTENGS